MKIRFWQLLLYFLAFDLIWQATIDYFNETSLFRSYDFSLKKTVLWLTSFASFFLYPLSVCYWFGRLLPRRTVLALTLTLACMPLIILFRYGLQEVAGPALWGYSNYIGEYTLKYYMLDNVYYAVLFSGFGFAYFFIQYARYTDKKQADLIMAVKESELSFLKSQINPHFLFNNLHCIYTLIYQKNENALSAVEKLSSLLRYALYEKREMVDLETEVLHLKDFIQLQRLRVTPDAAIQIDLENIDGTLSVSPQLMIGFAENAFKHGDLSDAETPLIITAFTEANTLTYEVSNKKSKYNKPADGGIGLQNIKRRLDLLYASRYSCTITDTEHQFTITLKIEL
ncbi:histidine kinase [Pseudoflavitalea sp. G-6-1-2]|uniref:sensor histidine kinase n=1 Tax=Pseudoflavitalea sp. G-6-1-2 TaxID=2728841 RepID=UPI00146C78FD|nr:sensor histidine kinase [Pseudoflavitalea sp. G-6-1-2]NML19532.1 histidine kinase [Pseudoflavitalea sp. G-6-1-2]